MKRFSEMNRYAKPAILAGAMALAAGPASALDVYLAAKPFTKQLPMSGGGTVDVPMWGYVEDTGGFDGSGSLVPHCYDILGTGAAAMAARLACVDALPAPAIPGPRIAAVEPHGAEGLRIFLTNGLPEPTSIIIPGQKLPYSGGATPTWDGGATGARTPGENQRVRSYGVEAPANGGSRSYLWNNTRGTPLERSGTFIYHSGTWPQKQVYMGLYGVLTIDVAEGEAYSGVPYDNEVVLFYSDVDPVLNAAVANGTYQTSIDYHAQWYLVNGEPYQDGVTLDIPAGTVGQSTLLRFLSAASETHVPTLQGLHMSIHAEDGFRYQYQNGDLFGGYAPREQYTAELPPLKTKDAILAATTPQGRYAVYDGNGYMTNPSDINNFAQADELGGMLRFLTFADNQPPVVTAPTPDPLQVTAALCADPVPASDSTIAAWLASAAATDTEDGALPVTNDAPIDFLVGGTLVTFTATDGASAVGTATATVQVAETPNTAPSVTAPLPLTLNVANGTTSVAASDPAIVAWLASAGATDLEDTGSLPVSNDAPASFPAAPLPGATTTVTFTATDACGLTGTQSSTVTIVAAAAANIAPVANADPDYVTDQDTPLTVPTPGVLENDTDADGGPAALTASLVSGATNGTVVLDPDGGFTYTPDAAYVGSDSFTYTAFDGLDDSAPATVTITVNEVVTPPITLYFSTTGNTNPPGVTGTPDNSDIYRWDGTAFSRVVDVTTLGVPVPGGANVDGMVFVDNTHFYLSFTDNRSLPGLGTVQDEDIVYYNAGTWQLYFEGTAVGLTANGEDIDAFDIVGGTLYISTLWNVNPPGAGGSADNADIYRWNGGASFTRVVDASAIGLPGSANVDALEVVDENHFYVSFNADSTTVPVIGSVQDEDVVEYNNGTWSTYFDGTVPGLTGGALDIDAIQVP